MTQLEIPEILMKYGDMPPAMQRSVEFALSGRGHTSESAFLYPLEKGLESGEYGVDSMWMGEEFAFGVVNYRTGDLEGANTLPRRHKAHSEPWFERSRILLNQYKAEGLGLYEPYLDLFVRGRKHLWVEDKRVLTRKDAYEGLGAELLEVAVLTSGEQTAGVKEVAEYLRSARPATHNGDTRTYALQRRLLNLLEQDPRFHKRFRGVPIITVRTQTAAVIMQPKSVSLDPKIDEYTILTGDAIVNDQTQLTPQQLGVHTLALKQFLLSQRRKVKRNRPKD